jgi:hypothetical protein
VSPRELAGQRCNQVLSVAGHSWAVDTEARMKDIKKRKIDRCLQIDRGKDIKKRKMERCLQTDRGKDIKKRTIGRCLQTDRQTEGKIQIK